MQANFNRACKTYDQHCSVQNKICHASITLLLKHASNFKVISDLACGTGESTRQLIDNIEYQTCYAIDFAEKLLNQAKSKLPADIKLVLSDFDALSFIDEEVDLVFCNMGLQWSLNLANTLSCFNKSLRWKGWLIFSMPIFGNFPELKDEYKLEMLTHEEITKTLENADFELVEHAMHIYCEQFPTPYAALQSIKKVGANTTMIQHKTQRISREEIHTMFIDPKVSNLTYQIGIYVARKK